MKSFKINRAVLFLLPALIGFSIFYIFPFVISAGYAFLDKPVGGRFVGLANFADLFSNKAYRLGLINTFKFVGVAVPLGMILALGAAMLINKIRGKKEIFTLLFLVPLVIPSASTAFFWQSMFARQGIVNGVLDTLGKPAINFLDGPAAFWVMVGIFLWKNIGYNMILFLSGLGSIPKDYYEAARIDGAGPLRSFIHITLPGLAGTVTLVGVMSVLNSFKIFKEIYLITGSYPHESIYTLQHFMNNMFSSLNYARLTSACTVLVLFMALFTKGVGMFEKRNSQH